MIGKLAKQIKEFKKPTIICIVFTSLEAVTSILIPYLMASIIDEGISKGNMGAIFKYGIIVVLLSLVSFAFGVLSGRQAAVASSGFAANLRSELYTRIQNFSFANIDKYSAPGLITRLTTDVTNIQNAFQMIIRMCIRSPFILISAVIMSMLINVKISLVFVLVIILLGASLYLIAVKAMKHFKEVFQQYDELNESVQENVTGIRVVKSFVREEYEKEKFEEAINNLYKRFVKAEAIVCTNGPVMTLFSYGCMLALSYLGAKFIVGGELTTGQLSSLFSYVSNIFMSLMMLSMVFVMLTISLASVERICEVLDEVPAIKDIDDPVFEIPDGSISFKHTDFSYKADAVKNVLSDINIDIKSGETIGIIGPTGSGKSTLISLISRLYDVTGGSVTVGGIDVRNYDIKSLRRNVSVVLQKNILFSGTIYDNLRWGNENATDEECEAACKISCADEFVRKRPDGYNTVIEQGGANVSGGQKQRLCIARALLKQPKILIMDNSTSAVDTATDAMINKAMQENLPGVTKIIISQRISSIRHADRIIVLDDGKVIGYDTHDNLVENNEVYRSINEVQSEGNADFDKPEG